jgi:hypothetical protein
MSQKYRLKHGGILKMRPKGMPLIFFSVLVFNISTFLDRSRSNVASD